MTEYSYSERNTLLKRVDVNISKCGVWLGAEAGTRSSMEEILGSMCHKVIGRQCKVAVTRYFSLPTFHPSHV